MKINFLGDSITDCGGASCRENGYPSLVAKYFHAEECNYGLAGTRIAKQKKIDPSHNLDAEVFEKRVAKLDRDAVFTFVFGGTNDYGTGDATLGCMEYRDTYTFYGAMHQLVTSLLEKFEKDKLCFILPIPRYNQDNPYGDGKTESFGALSAYIQAEKEVLVYYGVEYLDLTNKFPVPKSSQTDGYFLDGLHPNDNGHKLIADCLIEYLEKKL